MKTVMDIPRTNYSKGKVNNKFQQFANDYGFKVCSCVAVRSNTKAKIEASMKLLDEIRAYKSNQYFVAPEYIGKRLKLQVYDDQLYVYCNTHIITIHNI